MKLTGETKVLGEKPVPVPLCPPQIIHGLTRDRTRPSATNAVITEVCLHMLLALYILDIRVREYSG
jgi:hypothetical protein